MRTDWNTLALLGSAQLFSALITFASALALAALCAWVAPTPAIKKWCWCLPFVKVPYDLAGGIPDNAYIASRFAGQRWDLGSFQLGLGLEQPTHLLSLTAKVAARRHDTWFALGGGDAVANALSARGLAWLLATATVLVGVVALCRVGLRLWHGYATWRREQRLRTQARVVGLRRAGLRTIALLTHPAQTHTGLGGLWRPVIWLPQHWEQAPAEQRHAAIAHEHAHLRAWDPLLFVLLRLCRDVLWFVPGTGFVERRIRCNAELAADAAAVNRGTDPLALALAIATEGEGQLAPSPALGAPVVRQRVQRLTSAPTSRQPRFRPRTVLAVYLCISFLVSTVWGYV